MLGRRPIRPSVIAPKGAIDLPNSRRTTTKGMVRNKRAVPRANGQASTPPFMPSADERLDVSMLETSLWDAALAIRGATSVKRFRIGITLTRCDGSGIPSVIPPVSRRGCKRAFVALEIRPLNWAANSLCFQTTSPIQVTDPSLFLPTHRLTRSNLRPPRTFHQIVLKPRDSSVQVIGLCFSATLQ